MTLFFNILLLEQDTQCNPKLMVEKLKLWYSRKRIPKNYNTKIKPISNLFGDSFLLNPKDFFSDTNTDTAYKSQYLQLAGRRSYNDYKLTIRDLFKFEPKKNTLKNSKILVSLMPRLFQKILKNYL